MADWNDMPWGMLSTTSSVMFECVVVDVSSICGPSVDTSTTLVSEPTDRDRSTVGTCPTSMTRPSCFSFWNPLASAVIVYTPGGRLVKW